MNNIHFLSRAFLFVILITYCCCVVAVILFFYLRCVLVLLFFPQKPHSLNTKIKTKLHALHLYFFSTKGSVHKYFGGGEGLEKNELRTSN